MGTTTVSLSILAGITFGFLYLLITGIKWASERLEGGAGVVGKDRCARCGVTFVDVEDGTCSMCGLTVCTHCAIHYQRSWLCTSCIIKTDESLNANEWVLSHFKKRFQSTVAVMRKYGSFRRNRYFRNLIGMGYFYTSWTRGDTCDISGENPQQIIRNIMQAGLPLFLSESARETDVRDFVEKLTEHLIGGRLDNVRIDRVCTHPNYMKFMDKYEKVLSLTLSRLTSSIQMLIDGVNNEKVQSPRLVHQQLRELINEIIDEANNLDLSNDETDKIKELRSKTYEDILAIAVLNKASEKFLQPISNGTYDNLELLNNIKSGIFPELESEFEDLVNVPNYPDWNDNWHLEKKLDSGSSSVTMLIPSPNEEAKPRIGDVEVDQLSDLSDVEVEPVHDIEDNYPASPKEVSRLSPMARGRAGGFEDLDRDDEERDEYLHYREPDIPSIVEARNNVFRSLGTHSGEESDYEKDRGLAELTHRNSTKVRVIEQAYADRYLNGLNGFHGREYAMRNHRWCAVRVCHLVRTANGNCTFGFCAPRNVKEEVRELTKKTVNSLTCRNPARDHLY